jgi:pre-mRNA-splicing factor CDC5/CEF1
MTMAQTPLYGEENTPLHPTSSEGTGFESATPRHQVSFTPNPLATPAHDPGVHISATPRTNGSSVSATPMRDNLSINPKESLHQGGHVANRRGLNQALRAAFDSLPAPENNFELLAPEDEPEQTDTSISSAEDAAERDARTRRLQEQEAAKALSRRTQVVQRALPRPAAINLEELVQNLSVHDELDLLPDAQRLIDSELVRLLQHDSIAHPLPGSPLPGNLTSTYDIPSDDDLRLAKSFIHTELTTILGFPGANSAQLQDGLLGLAKAEPVDDTLSWANVRQQLTFDVAKQSWVDASHLDFAQHVAGSAFALDEHRKAMAKGANRAAKSEKKLGVMLGGYQARFKTLSTQLASSFQELQRLDGDLDAFSRLAAAESVAGPRRISSLREEVDHLEHRERLLQGRYAGLEAEKRESEGRITMLEERLLLEAESLNEVALSALEQEGGQ